MTLVLAGISILFSIAACGLKILLAARLLPYRNRRDCDGKGEFVLARYEPMVRLLGAEDFNFLLAHSLATGPRSAPN